MVKLSDLACVHSDRNDWTGKRHWQARELYI